MSAYGLQIFNEEGDLTVSSDAKLLHYLGKPEFMYMVQVSGNAEDTKSNARKAGYSIYRFYSNTRFVIAIDLVLLRNVGVIGIDLVSPGVWEIAIYCGSAGDGYGFDTVQHRIDIWAFGFIESAAEKWTLALYNESGQLAADLSRAHPLWPRAVINGYQTPTQNLPRLTRPAILGMPTKFSMFNRPRLFGGRLNDYVDQMDFWRRTADTTLTIITRTRLQYTINDPDDPDADGDGPCVGMIIEAANLP